MGNVSATAKGWLLQWSVMDETGNRRRKTKRLRDCTREQAEAELSKLEADTPKADPVGNPRDLFCRWCERLLCRVDSIGQPIHATSTLGHSDGKVACPRCRAWTPVTKAVPVAEPIPVTR